MALGDAAATAGMDVITDAGQDANKLASEITKTRDYIGAGYGGTAAATPNRGVKRDGSGRAKVAAPSAADDIATKGYVDAGIGGIDVSWGGITDKPSTFPPASHTHSGLSGTGAAFGINSNIGGAAGFWSNARLGCADRLYVTDHAFFTSLSAATSSYTVAYINGDGRLSKGASSVRFKKFISDVSPIALGNLFPSFKRFQMRSGDGVWRYGYTAEDIAANPDTEQFAVYERVIEEDGTAAHLKRDEAGNPIPESIDFIGLLLAQVAQLNARIEELEAGR